MSPVSDALRQARTRDGLNSRVKDIHAAVVNQQNRENLAAENLVNIAAAQLRAAALGE